MGRLPADGDQGPRRAAGRGARRGPSGFRHLRPRAICVNKRARDRYARARATGAVYGPNERAEITDAGLVVAPDDVAASLGLDPGSKAIRRRRIVSDGSGPIELSISWFSPGLARIAPRLLKKGRIREGTLNYLERATGRRGRVARDWVGARLGTRDELSALGLREPQAVLVIRHIVLDGSGEPLEFVEATYPPGRWAVEGEYSLPG